MQCAVIGKCRVPADMPLGEVLDALRQTRRGKFEIYERIFSRGSWLKDVLLLVNDPDPYVASLYRTRVRSTVSAARLIGEWSGGNQPRTRNLTRLTSTVRWRERAHAICSRLGAFSSQWLRDAARAVCDEISPGGYFFKPQALVCRRANAEASRFESRRPGGATGRPALSTNADIRW